MKKDLAKAFGVAVVFVVVALIVAVVLKAATAENFACDDSICEAHRETVALLDHYERYEDAEPVYEYFTTYNGDAPGSESRATFVEWGNKNIDQMNELLEDWPSKRRSIERRFFFELLEWNARDSGQTIQFEIPEP